MTMSAAYPRPYDDPVIPAGDRAMVKGNELLKRLTELEAKWPKAERLVVHDMRDIHRRGFIYVCYEKDWTRLPATFASREIAETVVEFINAWPEIKIALGGVNILDAAKEFVRVYKTGSYDEWTTAFNALKAATLSAPGEKEGQ